MEKVSCARPELAAGAITARWPALAQCREASTWLQVHADLGLAARTIEAYARGLADYLGVCAREGIDPLSAGRAEVARYVRDLARRPHPRGTSIVSLDSGVGLANATLQQRLVIVRLFCDYLMEEEYRGTNPVGRGRYTPGRAFGGHRDRGLVRRFSKLPWIPTDAEWHRLLVVARQASLRTRLMLALAYDAALRREELCRLQTEDVDPAFRTLRVRAETTKTRRSRVVPYSLATGVLLQQYLAQRRALSAARGRLFLSESRRNRTAPITLWTWSKVVRALAPPRPPAARQLQTGRVGRESLRTYARAGGGRPRGRRARGLGLSKRSDRSRVSPGALRDAAPQSQPATGATAAGAAWHYYDLGHGYCTYNCFEQCPHRMACARCDFYLPKASSRAQLSRPRGRCRGCWSLSP
jgi:integrase/recombinase XerD